MVSRLRTALNGRPCGGWYAAGRTPVGGTARVHGGDSVRPLSLLLACRRGWPWRVAEVGPGVSPRLALARRQPALSDLVASDSRHFFAVWELSALSPVTLMVFSEPPATAASDSTPVVTTSSELSTKPTSSE